LRAGKIAYEAGKVAYAVSPLGVSEMIEEYTGQQLSWKKRDVARFKEKGKEFETSVEADNTIGMANVIDPQNPKDFKRLYLIGQPLSADPNHKIGGAYEGGFISNATNPIPGGYHKKCVNDQFII
jgi:hypothetical protein